MPEPPDTGLSYIPEAEVSPGTGRVVMGPFHPITPLTLDWGDSLVPLSPTNKEEQLVQQRGKGHFPASLGCYWR